MTKLEELKAAAEAIAAELEATADTYEAELEAAADTYEAELKAAAYEAYEAREAAFDTWHFGIRDGDACSYDYDVAMSAQVDYVDAMSAYHAELKKTQENTQ